MKKFQIVLGMLMMLGGFAGSVFAFNHCQNPTNELCKNQTQKGGIESDVNLQCRSNPSDACWSLGCFVYEGDDGDGLTIVEPSWFNNKALSNDDYYKGRVLGDYDDFMDFYLRPRNPSLLASDVRILQKKMNEIAYWVENGDGKTQGSCSYVCEDGRLGINTLDNFSKCLPKCHGEDNCPDFDEDEGFTCSEGQEIGDDGCCADIQKTKDDCKDEIEIDPPLSSDVWDEYKDNIKIVDNKCCVEQSFLDEMSPVEKNKQILENSFDICSDQNDQQNEENDGDGECTIECGSGEKLMNEDSSDCKCVCDPTAILKNGEKQCCGIRLNTNVPFIGNCIQFVDEGENVDGGENTTVVNPNTAFPLLVGGLSKILVTVILVISFLLIIVAGVMISTAGADTSNAGKGKDLILKVIVGIALLGMSGMILKIVNPNFFG